MLRILGDAGVVEESADDPLPFPDIRSSLDPHRGTAFLEPLLVPPPCVSGGGRRSG